MLIRYDSNNSGGRWWLKDKDWKRLEKGGWKVIWANEPFVYTADGRHSYDKDGFPKTRFNKKLPKRWLGALASEAFKHFSSPKEAIEEFQQITGDGS